MDQYPAEAGFQDTDTSRAAAATVNASVLRDIALSVLQKHSAGLTADEVASIIKESVLSIRPRITELNKLAKIEDSGQRRRNQSGRYAIVWRVRQSQRFLF